MKRDTFIDHLQKVSIIGAGGKMGSGISLLLLQMLAKLNMGSGNGNSTQLILMDTQLDSLKRLEHYLLKQLIKFAEKNIVQLRELTSSDPQIIENADVISAFSEMAQALIHFTTDLQAIKDSTLVFEVAVENPDLKIKILKSLKSICNNKTFYLTNTSSIPISTLEQETGLTSRIMGCHFYNPPAVQKLIETIKTKNTQKTLEEFTGMLGKQLGKILIPSMDQAGFIGNGHFIREGLFALKKVEEFTKEMEIHEAFAWVNHITNNYMLRPMGIIQLLDYVGLDVFAKITGVMQQYIPEEDFSSNILHTLIEHQIMGGQHGSGTQKNGIFKYENNQLACLYNWTDKKYYNISDSWYTECIEKLGPLPALHKPWKTLMKSPSKNKQLQEYFTQLTKSSTKGAAICLEFLRESRQIAQNLVKEKVAASIEDVNNVLCLGFYHAYGPINEMY